MFGEVECAADCGSPICDECWTEHEDVKGRDVLICPDCDVDDVDWLPGLCQGCGGNQNKKCENEMCGNCCDCPAHK